MEIEQSFANTRKLFNDNKDDFEEFKRMYDILTGLFNRNNVKKEEKNTNIKHYIANIPPEIVTLISEYSVGLIESCLFCQIFNNIDCNLLLLNDTMDRIWFQINSIYINDKLFNLEKIFDPSLIITVTRHTDKNQDKDQDKDADKDEDASSDKQFREATITIVQKKPDATTAQETDCRTNIQNFINNYHERRASQLKKRSPNVDDKTIKEWAKRSYNCEIDDPVLCKQCFDRCLFKEDIESQLTRARTLGSWSSSSSMNDNNNKDNNNDNNNNNNSSNNVNIQPFDALAMYSSSLDSTLFSCAEIFIEKCHGKDCNVWIFPFENSIYLKSYCVYSHVYQLWCNNEMCATRCSGGCHDYPAVCQCDDCKKYYTCYQCKGQVCDWCDCCHEYWHDRGEGITTCCKHKVCLHCIDEHRKMCSKYAVNGLKSS